MEAIKFALDGISFLGRSCRRRRVDDYSRIANCYLSRWDRISVRNGSAAFIPDKAGRRACLARRELKRIEHQPSIEVRREKIIEYKRRHHHMVKNLR